MNHFTVLSDNLEATRRFYCDLFGFKVGWRPPFQFPGWWLYAEGDDRPILHVIHQDPLPKRRFSEFPSELACNQEYAGGLEQGLNDEAEPVVAQREAPVFEHPSIAALHRPAPLAEP